MPGAFRRFDRVIDRFSTAVLVCFRRGIHPLIGLPILEGAFRTVALLTTPATAASTILPGSLPRVVITGCRLVGFDSDNGLFSLFNLGIGCRPFLFSAP